MTVSGVWSTLATNYHRPAPASSPLSAETSKTFEPRQNPVGCVAMITVAGDGRHRSLFVLPLCWDQEMMARCKM